MFILKKGEWVYESPIFDPVFYCKKLKNQLLYKIILFAFFIPPIEVYHSALGRPFVKFKKKAFS